MNRKILTTKLLCWKEKLKMLKLSEILNLKSKKLKNEDNNLIIRSKDSEMKKNHWKNSTLKLKTFWIKKILLLMVWKKISILTRRNSLRKNKKITRSGILGKMVRKKDLMTLSKRSKRQIKKMTDFGMNLINKKRLIGNKNTMLIGSNGKWKSRAEKSMKLKERRRDKSTKREIRNSNSKKNFKNTLDKLSSAINLFNTWTISKTTGTELTRPRKTKRKKLWMLVQNLQQILNGKRKKFRCSFLKRLKPKIKLQPRKERRTKTKLKTRKNNKRYSTFLTMFKINLKPWRFSLPQKSKKLIRRLKSWKIERNYSKEVVKKSKYQRLTLNCWRISKQKNLLEDKWNKKKLKRKRNSQLFDLNHWLTIANRY